MANIAVHFGADGAIQGASLHEVNLSLKGLQNLVPKGPEEVSVASGVFLTRQIVGKRRRGEVSPGCRLPPLEVEIRERTGGVKRCRWEEENPPPSDNRDNRPHKWIVRVGRRFRGKTTYTPQGRVVEYSGHPKSGNNYRPPRFERSWRTPARSGFTSQQGPMVRGVGSSAEVVASASTNDVTTVLAVPGGSVGQSGSDAHSASDVVMGESGAEDAPTSVAAEAPVSTVVDMGEAPLGDGQQMNSEVSQEMELSDAEPGPIHVHSGGEPSAAMGDGDDEDLPDAEEAKVETTVESSQVEQSTVVETTVAEVTGENSVVMTVPPSAAISEVSAGYAEEAVASSSECPKGPSEAANVESSSTAVTPGVVTPPASSPEVTLAGSRSSLLASQTSAVPNAADESLAHAMGSVALRETVTLPESSTVVRSSLLASQTSAVPNAADEILARAMGSVALRETTVPESSAGSQLGDLLSGLQVSNTSRSNPVRKDHERSKRLTAALASKTSTRKSGGIQKLGGNKVEVGRKFHREMAGNDRRDEGEAARRRRIKRAKMPFYYESEEEEEEEEMEKEVEMEEGKGVEVVQVVAQDDGEEEGDSDTPAVDIVLGDEEEY